MTHRIVIENWHPASTNKLMRLHWAARNTLLKADAEMVAVYARLACVPTAGGKRRVKLTFAAPGGRGAKTGDSDARLKSGLDACVRCGLIVDDSPAWCEVEVACVRGKKSTTIELEDLEA